jgi:hypothetical protein
MYIHTYILLYILMYIHTYVCTYEYTYICIWMYGGGAAGRPREFQTPSVRGRGSSKVVVVV